LSKLSAAWLHLMKQIQDSAVVSVTSAPWFGGPYSTCDNRKAMSTLSATFSEEYTQRYEALLRATNAIGSCSGHACESAA
jgi:hypothetical protein